MDNIEILGITAALLILISFILSGEAKIRSVNIIGALLFVIYGLITGALSIWFLNAALFFVHCYKLKKIKKKNLN